MDRYRRLQLRGGVLRRGGWWFDVCLVGERRWEKDMGAPSLVAGLFVGLVAGLVAGVAGRSDQARRGASEVHSRPKPLGESSRLDCRLWDRPFRHQVAKCSQLLKIRS